MWIDRNSMYGLVALACVIGSCAHAQSLTGCGTAGAIHPDRGSASAALAYVRGAGERAVPTLRLDMRVPAADQGAFGAIAFIVQENSTGMRAWVVPDGNGKTGRLVTESTDTPLPFWSRGPLPDKVQTQVVLGDALARICVQQPASGFEVYAGYGVLTPQARKEVEARFAPQRTQEPTLANVTDPRLKAEIQAALARSREARAQFSAEANRKLEEDHAIYTNALTRGTCWKVLSYACNQNAPQTKRSVSPF